MNAMHG